MWKSHNSLITVAVVIAGAFIASKAPAQSSGDGFRGPTVFGDAALDQSLSALNSHLQARYAHDDMMAALHAPKPADFAEIAAGLGAAPEIAMGGEAEFGPAISGGEGLDANLATLRETLARDESLFIQIAAAESGKAAAFSEMAAAITARRASRENASLSDGASAFGDLIADDASLNAHLDNLSVVIAEFSDREVLLAQAVPTTTGASFDWYVVALANFD